MMLLVSFIVFAALSKVAYSQPIVSQPNCGGTSDPITTAWCSSLPLALIAVLIAFSIAAFIYMLGVVTHNDRIRNFGVGEIYEAIASMMIVAFFLYITAVMLNFIPSIIGVSGNPYTQALAQIKDTAISTQSAYSSYLLSYYQVAGLVRQEIIISIPNAEGSITPQSISLIPFGIFLYLSIVAPTVLVSILLLDGMYVLWAEYYLLIFFSIAAIPAFIVPGVVLRSLLPTRGFGGLMIAVGIGFYIVMPTLFAFAYNTINPIYTPTLAVGISHAAFAGVEQRLSSFWLSVLFYPPLIIALTYAFIVQLSQLLGAATTIAGNARKFI